MRIYNFEKFPSPWLHWRYTFLRSHINELLKDKSRLVYTHWQEITLENFFFPLPEMPSPCMPLRIKPAAGRTGSPPSTETSLVELLMREDCPRFIFLVADGGAGKTTLLLKTALDCVHSQGELRAHGFVPAFIDLRGLEPALITADNFYQLITTQTVGGSALSPADCKRALKYTDNALLLFDGLNEIQSDVKKDLLSIAFNNLIRDIPSSSRVIVASREENLLDLLDGRKKRFARFIVQPIKREEISPYLEKALGGEKAEKMLRALRNQIGLLENPMLLQLFSMLTPEQVGSELNRALLYRYAIQNWIRVQFERESFPSFARRGRDPVDDIYHLLQRLAVKMVELVKGQLSVKEANDVIKACRDEDWYPVDGSGKKVDSSVIYEEVFRSGLLRLVC